MPESEARRIEDILLEEHRAEQSARQAREDAAAKASLARRPPPPPSLAEVSQKVEAALEADLGALNRRVEEGKMEWGSPGFLQAYHRRPLTKAGLGSAAVICGVFGSVVTFPIGPLKVLSAAVGGFVLGDGLESRRMERQAARDLLRVLNAEFQKTSEAKGLIAGGNRTTFDSLGAFDRSMSDRLLSAHFQDVSQDELATRFHAMLRVYARLSETAVRRGQRIDFSLVASDAKHADSLAEEDRKRRDRRWQRKHSRHSEGSDGPVPSPVPDRPESWPERFSASPLTRSDAYEIGRYLCLPSVAATLTCFGTSGLWAAVFTNVFLAVSERYSLRGRTERSRKAYPGSDKIDAVRGSIVRLAATDERSRDLVAPIDRHIESYRKDDLSARLRMAKRFAVAALVLSAVATSYRYFFSGRPTPIGLTNSQRPKPASVS